MPAAGVPANVAVPFPLLVNVTPEGSAPVRTSVGVGEPVVVTLNNPLAPTVNVVALALVIAGACDDACTVSVNACCADEAPLEAVKVSG